MRSGSTAEHMYLFSASAASVVLRDTWERASGHRLISWESEQSFPLTERPSSRQGSSHVSACHGNKLGSFVPSQHTDFFSAF